MNDQNPIYVSDNLLGGEFQDALDEMPAPKLHVNRFASKAIAARAVDLDGIYDEDVTALVHALYLDLRYAELCKEQAKVAMKAVTADLRSQGLLAEPRGTVEWSRFDVLAFRVKDLYDRLMAVTVPVAGDLEPIRVWAEQDRIERRAAKLAAFMAPRFAEDDLADDLDDDAEVD